MEKRCEICKELITETCEYVSLTEKGSQGVNSASIKRGDDLKTVSGQNVHIHCRKQYCNPNVIKKDKKIESVENEINVKSTRSQGQFVFQEHCLFCGDSAKLSENKRGHEVYPVRTFAFQEKIQRICEQRGDDWANTVQGRLNSAHDLHAADTIYHQRCSVNFRTGKQIPATSVTSCKYAKLSPGRKGCPDRLNAFLKVAEYLVENDNEQITINDLVGKMGEICGDEAYTAKYMKQKLLEHFGSSVIITELDGVSNVVTFRHTAESLLHNFYKEPKELDFEKEKRKLIETAAKLIKSDIKAKISSKAVYPSATDISSLDRNIEYLPETLRLLLGILITDKDSNTKVAAIGQAIMQAVRSRIIIAPLQLGLASQMHHHFASKFLVDTLHSLGFCSSYAEVSLFETSAAAFEGHRVPDVSSVECVQFVADNVDHNLGTIDGLNTFHGMGMIACVFPPKIVSVAIPRLKTTTDLLALAHIDNYHYKLKEDFLAALVFEKLDRCSAEDVTWKFDILTKVVHQERVHRPGWSGMMQMVQQGKYPGISSINFLPMIDMNPSDISCIYSTLTYLSKLACLYGCSPVVTFDQPLYWKAFTIVSSDKDLHSVVLKLGGFHTEMSFLGCIGHIMAGSGLQETMGTVYAANAVVHMLSGKAVSRAVRGHFLVDQALNILMIEKEVESNVNIDQDSSFENDLQEAVTIFQRLMEGEVSLSAVCSEPILGRIQKRLTHAKQSLASSRTASLWTSYMDMLDMLRKFIKAERTGNWKLHLQVLTDMLRSMWTQHVRKVCLLLYPENAKIGGRTS